MYDAVKFVLFCFFILVLIVLGKKELDKIEHPRPNIIQQEEVV